MPSTSIFRRPGTKHYQLVHRSRRDPLIHDPDASQHVLKPFVRENDKKGRTRAELEAILAPEVVEHDVRANVGEAALYGIYFDDTEYDYMRHLRAVGTEEEGVESTLIEAPCPQNSSKSKVKPISDGPSHGLPAEVFPSKTEMPRNYESQEAIPSSIAGFQPDMNPHLRQALDALEDDEFVDDDVDDDFFKQLVRDGEREEGEQADYEFYECEPLDSESDEGEWVGEDESWEVRFAKFKEGRMNAPPPPDSDIEDIHSEDGDTVGYLPKLPVIGGKRRRKGTSDASGYSMSSSSMYRTETLLTLDERFDQLMVKEYGSEGGALDSDELETASTDSPLSSSAPELITTREDYAEMVDEFIERYELLGRKLKPVLAGESGADKLETLRRGLGQDERVRVIAMEGGDRKEMDDEELFQAYDANEKEDRWDCETVLTTYSNLENHPRIIRARSLKPVQKINLDPCTGLPCVANESQGTLKVEERVRVVKPTASRARNETKEEKRARKQAVKADRQARRADKKTMKEQFSMEIKHQAQGLSNHTNMRRIRKL